MAYRISKIINELLESPLYKDRWREHLIKSMWTGWVGEKMAQHIRPCKIKEDKLVVIINDERWAKAFEELQDNVKKKLNYELRKEAVKGFEIWMDKEVQRKNRPKGVKREYLHQKPPLESSKIDITHRKSDDQEPADRKLDYQNLDENTEENLKMIKAPEIRQALRRLLIKSKNFRKDRLL